MRLKKLTQKNYTKMKNLKQILIAIRDFLFITSVFALYWLAMVIYYG